MNCDRIQDRLPLYVGGELETRASCEVELHLRECLPCYRELVQYRDAMEDLREARVGADLQRMKDPDEFVDAVLAQIDGPPPSAPVRVLFLRYGGWMAAAATFVAALLIRFSEPDRSAGTPIDRSSNSLSAPDPTQWVFSDEMHSVPLNEYEELRRASAEDLNSLLERNEPFGVDLRVPVHPVVNSLVRDY